MREEAATNGDGGEDDPLHFVASSFDDTSAGDRFPVLPRGGRKPRVDLRARRQNTRRRQRHWRRWRRFSRQTSPKLEPSAQKPTTTSTRKGRRNEKGEEEGKRKHLSSSSSGCFAVFPLSSTRNRCWPRSRTAISALTAAATAIKPFISRGEAN